MPRGAEPELPDEPSPPTPLEALERGIELFNQERFFEAHDAWESAWHAAPEPERDFWQGLTQIAVGFTHFKRGNVRGACTLLERGARRLSEYGAVYLGVPVRALAASATDAASALRRDATNLTLPCPVLRRDSPSPAP